MQKVLVLAFFFPPIAASGSLRAAGIVRHLPDHGFKPTILAADPDSVYPPTQTDDSLDVLINHSLEVHRISYRSRLEQLLAVRNRFRAIGGARSERTSNKSTAAHLELEVEVGLKDLLLDRLLIFPDHQKYWTKPVLNWVSRLPACERPDVVLATANPWSSLELAQKIAESLEIPWVADFRDPWFRNPKPQPNVRLLPQVQRREAAAIRNASHIIANTNALAASLRTDHPKAAMKITTVTNGFAGELMPKHQERANNGMIELSHFGTVYPLRNPKTLLQALAQLAAKRDNLSIRLRFIGGWDVQDSETETLAATLEEQGLLVREGSVPRDQALQKMAAASHLLILQQDFPLQIPAKLYEYIATGRPIVALGGPGATRQLIEDCKLGICCGNNEGEITALLCRLLEHPDDVPSPPADVIDRFEYRQISAQVADVLRKVLAQ